MNFKNLSESLRQAVVDLQYELVMTLKIVISDISGLDIVFHAVAKRTICISFLPPERWRRM
jgi:hypothetical protein